MSLHLWGLFCATANQHTALYHFHPAVTKLWHIKLKAFKYQCMCVCAVCVCHVCACHLPTVPDLISLTFPAVFGKILSYSAKRCRNSSFTVPSLILISHLGDGNLHRLQWFIRIGLYNSDSQTLRGNKKSMSHRLHTQSLTNTQSISHLVLLMSKEKNLNY